MPHPLSYPPGVPHSRGHGQVTQIVSWAVSCSGMCPVHKKYGARGAIFSSSCVLRGCRHLESWNNPCHASRQASLEGPWESGKPLPNSEQKRESQGYSMPVPYLTEVETKGEREGLTHSPQA